MGVICSSTHLGEHGLEPRHHALEAAEVDVRTVVEALEQLVRVLRHLVLGGGVMTKSEKRMTDERELSKCGP